MATPELCPFIFKQVRRFSEKQLQEDKIVRILNEFECVKNRFTPVKERIVISY